jgi:hypothetical protein
MVYLNKSESAICMVRRSGSSCLRRIILATVILMPGMGFVDLPSAVAKETFKDEAGRLIYTVDDDGIVTMFESSPGIDFTLSVTRGTREEMQPKVTEIIPSFMPAGTSPVLKIKGKNLVGATVKLSRSGVELGPYAGKPTVIEIPIRVASNMEPGEVILHLTTPIGSTQASFKVTEMQIGSATPSRRERDERLVIPTTAPSSCPEGMAGVAAESGGFCIDIDRSLNGDIRKAEKACAMAGKRLCQATEWQHACEQSRSNGLALKNMVGEWEWTGSYDKYDVLIQTGELDLSDELKSILLGKTDCSSQYIYPSWRPGPFPGRCCK